MRRAAGAPARPGPPGTSRPCSGCVRLVSASPAPSVSASGSVVHSSESGSSVTSRTSTATQSQSSSMSPENLNSSCGAVAAGQVERLAEPLVGVRVRARRHVLRAAVRAERRGARAQPVGGAAGVGVQRVLRPGPGSSSSPRRWPSGPGCPRPSRRTPGQVLERAAVRADERVRVAGSSSNVLPGRRVDVRPQVVLEEVVVVRDAAVRRPSGRPRRTPASHGAVLVAVAAEHVLAVRASSRGSGNPKLRNSLPSAYCAPAYLPV